MTINVVGDETYPRFSAAAMLIPTNDAFFAIQGMKLLKNDKTRIATTVPYDAGKGTPIMRAEPHSQAPSAKEKAHHLIQRVKGSLTFIQKSTESVISLQQIATGEIRSQELRFYKSQKVAAKLKRQTSRRQRK